MGLAFIRHSVAEFGHAARRGGQFANQLTKPFKATAFFRNRHRQQGLAFFAHTSAFGHKAQAVKVHVGAAQDTGVGLPLGFVAGHVLLDGGNPHGASGFHNAAGVYKNIFNSRAHRIGIYFYPFIHQCACQPKGFHPHLFNRGTV